jgi:ribosomal protein L29
MDLDLSKTIGLGLTTAIVGTYTIYQRAVRQGSPYVAKKRPESENALLDDVDELPTINEQPLGEPFEAIPPAPLTVESIQPPAPPSPPAARSRSPSAKSPAKSPSIFVLTSSLHSDDNSAAGEEEHPLTHEQNAEEEEDDGDENATTGSIDFSLYQSLLQENEDLKSKLDEITNTQERQLNALMPTTPKGTRWNPHALLDEVTRLRMELSNSNQSLNEARDHVFVVQQQLHEEQKKVQLITNMIMMGRGGVKGSSLDDIVEAIKSWKDLAMKANEFEKRSQEQETLVVDSTAKLVDLREQLNSLRLGKVQEVTELRRQIATMEETYREREASFQARIQRLESRLIDASMQLNSTPVREELSYMRVKSPQNASFEDITSAITSNGVPRAATTSTPNRLRGSTTPKSSSSTSTTPNRLRKSTSATGENGDFTATVPTPLVFSNALNAALSRDTSLLSPTRRAGTPTSASRSRSGSASKLKSSSSSSLLGEPTTPSRGSSRLSNYTANSASKSFSTQEFLRMLNDPSGTNGGL